MMELTQHLSVPTQIDFLKVSSYGSGTSTSGKVDIQFDTSRNLAGKNVLIVDDVVDSGLTLKAVRELFRTRNCKSIRLAAMLDKKERRLVKMVPDYYGFVIPDEFVVGFGLDYNEDYRTLPYVSISSVPSIINRSQKIPDLLGEEDTVTRFFRNIFFYLLVFILGALDL